MTARWLDAQASANTQIAYRRDIVDFFEWCHRRGVDPSTATATRVRPYDAHMKRRQLARSSRHRKLTTVSSWYRAAMWDDLELVASNPMDRVRRPGRDATSPNVGVEDRELLALLDAADRSTAEDAALVRLLYLSGARVSELCTADTSALATENGARVLVVVRKGGHTGKVVLPRFAADALDEHLDGRGGPLFCRVDGRARDRHWATYRLALTARAAGVRLVRPHAFRHALTTRLLLDGYPLQEVRDVLGHRSSDTTLRYHRSAVAPERSPTHQLGELLSRGVRS